MKEVSLFKMALVAAAAALFLFLFTLYRSALSSELEVLSTALTPAFVFALIFIELVNFQIYSRDAKLGQWLLLSVFDLIVVSVLSGLSSSFTTYIVNLIFRFFTLHFIVCLFFAISSKKNFFFSNYIRQSGFVFSIAIILPLILFLGDGRLSFIFYCVFAVILMVLVALGAVFSAEKNRFITRDKKEIILLNISIILIGVAGFIYANANNKYVFLSSFFIMILLYLFVYYLKRRL